MFVTGLEGVDDSQDFGRVAPGRGWVGEDGSDLLLRIDDEDGADGEGNTLLVDVRCVLVVDPGSRRSASCTACLLERLLYSHVV